MDFQPLLTAWKSGEDDFNDALEEFLCMNEGRLPLDDFCEAGGGPDWDDCAEFTVDSTIETDSQIVSEVMVYFNESIPSGCRDINWTEKRNGKLIIKIDKDTGDGIIESSQDYERFNAEDY